MAHIKLDIRALIKNGEMSSDKAGRLIALDNYEPEGVLSAADDRALQQTATDKNTLNHYITGSNLLNRIEPVMATMMTEMNRDVNFLSFLFSSVAYRAVVIDAPKRPTTVSADRYKVITQEKAELRKQRNYTLMLLYRAIVENLVKNRHQEHAALIAELVKEKEEGEKKKAGFHYGISLIENAGEIYSGWFGWEDGKFTLADFAEDLPKVHSIVMQELRALHVANQITADPDKIDLKEFKNTVVTGEQLAGIDNALLKEWFNTPEGYDNGLDEGLTIAERYQEYAIIQNPMPSMMKDGYYQQDVIERIEDQRYVFATDIDNDLLDLRRSATAVYSAVYTNLLMACILVPMRLKTGRLLGLERSEVFKERSETMFNIDSLVNHYRSIRHLYDFEDLMWSRFVEAPKYLQFFQKALQPFDLEGLQSDEWVKQAAELSDKMTIENIQGTHEQLLLLLDKVRKYYEEKNSE